ncbi:MAG: ATP-dependent RNA helicase, partial [Spirochaetales bacterium]|nr:ATP-dependent RNA helicase [Spirochaetales bacterium]
TVSVSEFIANNMDSRNRSIVAYKMRFEDTTDILTKIKIMTDGILLQELKADKLLSKYSVIMVDEAHERSLNIDFILGLLKSILTIRHDLKVIISSATINGKIFSEYVGGAPIVHIETRVFPIQTIYVNLHVENNYENLLQKIGDIVFNELRKKETGDILIFLPGERAIKDCINLLQSSKVSKKLFIIPLYGRLTKEEQERVFIKTPNGKIKVVVSTNIAETSITIDQIKTVIDSGLAKINFYSPRTFTESLIESPVSKAASDQRKGRSGRTGPGTCYRLYSKRDFDTRAQFTLEEIFRTDLSEVVLQMAELGITDFGSFDFISTPGSQGIAGAIESLKLLGALDNKNKLTAAGQMMVKFPLLPRHSRMIVESILRYPDVVEEVLISASFLSSHSPFLLPQNEEIEARNAQHYFRDPSGDFISNIKLFKIYSKIGDSEKRQQFCDKYYLDLRTLNMIVNIKEQLESIVREMGIPIINGGTQKELLCSIAAGLIQFVCIRSGKSSYRSLTAGQIHIHPGSVMFRESPEYIVAGEIVKTSRMFARSVSVIQKNWLPEISPDLSRLVPDKRDQRNKKDKKTGKIKDTSNTISINSKVFQLVPFRGKKKIAILPWEEIRDLVKDTTAEKISIYNNVRGKIIFRDMELETGSRIVNIIRITPHIDPEGDLAMKSKSGGSFSLNSDLKVFENMISRILKIVRVKKKGRVLGYLSLETDEHGTYWLKTKKGFYGAVEESLSSLEVMADEIGNNMNSVYGTAVSLQYRKLTAIFESL